MIKVALRVYNREIETLIDQGHTEEAVAHCMHILKTFPKHLETYRLLGKAYLEAHRYSEAADIFLRVLLAVPDDFVSHLGMSIVNDERGDLPGAIWHMERAYEVNSTNGGIQSELRRLYGRRDGVEPTRIYLTRGALAQIYMKAGEYQQAITEIKAVLADDGTRTDMKSLLARAYFRTGMKNEAVETCIELLKLYPYSLDGNHILVEILPGTSMAQGVEQYQRRIRSLDPYAAAAPGSVFDTQSVPNEAVMVDHLEWEPGLRSKIAASTSAPAAGAQPATPAGEIPAWMEQSGWGPSSGEAQPESAQPEQSAPATPTGEELAAAEIPDWLKAMAPPAAALGSLDQDKPEKTEKTDEGADFEWLASLGAPAGAETSSPEQTPPAEPVASLAPAAETPADDSSMDWLNNLVPPATTGAVLAADEGLDWLKDSAPAEKPADGKPEVELPDWLSNLGQAETPSTEATESAPDWLKDLPIETPAAGTSALESAAGQVEALAAEPVSTPETPAIETPTAELPAIENVPDWMKDVAAEPVSTSETPAIETPTAELPAIENVPDWMKDVAAEPVSTPETPAIETPAAELPAIENVPDWMKDAAAEPVSTPETPTIETPAAELPAIENVPDWMKDLAAEPVSTSETPAAETPAAELPAIENVPDWMKDLAAEPVSTSETPAAEADTDWLNDLAGGSTSTPETSAAEADTDWLKDLAAGPDSAPETPAANKGDTDWLNEFMATPTQPLKPTGPADDWLDAVEQPPVTQGAVPEEPAKVEEPSGSLLDRLETVSGISPALEESPTQPQAQPAADEVTAGSTEQEEAFKWLENLMNPQGTTPLEPAAELNAVAETPAEPVSEPATADSAEKEEALAWLQSLTQNKDAMAEKSVNLPAMEPGAEANLEAPAPEQPAVEMPAGEATSTPTAEIPAEETLSALVSGPGTSASEQDDALAWLESLAQKQGAKPEELITPEAERSETAPTWVTEQPAAEMPAAEATPAPTGEIPAEETLSALVSGPGTSASEQDDALAWLESLAQKQGAKPEELITPPAERSETAPTWVTDQPAAEQPAAEMPAEEMPAAEATPAPSAEIPAEETLSALVSGPGTSASEQDDALAWLESLAQKQGAKPEELITPAAERSETAPTWVTEQPVAEQPAAEMPAAEATPAPSAEIPAEETLSALVSGPGTSASEQDDALAWLESLAQKQGAKPEELITPAAERSETAPTWVTEQPAAEIPAVEATPAPTAEIPAEETLSALVSGPGTSASEQDDALAWLESLAQKQGAKPEELITPEAERSETAPTWVTEQPAAEIPAVEATPAPTAEIPAEEILSALVSGPGTSASEQDDALAWLESLAQKQGAKPEELITPPAERSETAPTWVTEQPAAEMPAAEAGLEPGTEAALAALLSGGSEAEDEDSLDWLNEEPIAAAPVEQNLAAEPAESLPEVPAKLADTQPTRVAHIAPALDIDQPTPETPAFETGTGAALPALVSSTGEADEEDSLDWLTEEPIAKAPASESLVAAETAVEQNLAAPDFEPPAELPAILSDTQPTRVAATAAAEPVATPEIQPTAVETPTAFEALIPAELETEPVPAQPDLTELGTASAGFADAAAAEEDFDWLGDLSQPVEPVVAERTDQLQIPPVEAQPAAASLPDAPDVSLDWLAGANRFATPAPAEPSAAEAAPESPDVTRTGQLTAKPEEASDWYSSLEQPGSALTSVPMPWEQESTATEPALDQAAPVSFEPEPDTATPTGPDNVEPKTVRPNAWEQGGTPTKPVQIEPEPVSLEAPEDTAAPGQDEIEPVNIASLPWEPASEVEESSASSVPAPSAGISDEDSAWLAGLGADELKTSAPLPWETDATIEETPAASEPTQTAEPTQVESAPSAGISEEDSAWLAGLGTDELKTSAPLPWESEASLEETTPTSAPVEVEPAPDAGTSEDDAAWLASLDEEDEPKAVEALPWETASSAAEPASESQVEEIKPTEQMPWEQEVAAQDNPAQPQSGSSDISEWLKDLHDEPEQETTAPETPSKPTWLSPISAPAEPADSVFEELPDWLRDPTVDEHAPSKGAASEPVQPTEELEIPARAQQVSAPAPVQPSEELETPAREQQVSTPAPEPSPAATQPQAAAPAQPRPVAPSGGDKEAIYVQKARESLAQGDLNNAMGEYSRLIRRGKHTEEVIHDLQQAVYSHPVDVIVWQTLGDAYFRANRLQEALDAYGKAEGLLR